MHHFFEPHLFTHFKPSSIFIYLGYLLISLFTTPAKGSGFQINEHSAIGLGRAFAGEAAVTDNPSVAMRNPAAMTYFDQNNLAASFALISPKITTRVVNSNLDGVPTGSQTYSDIISNIIISNFYYIQPINEDMAFGFSAFSNFGFDTHYPEDALAGPVSGKNKLTTIDFNPSFAYRLNQALRLGIGVSLVRAQAQLKRTAGSLAPLLQNAGYAIASAKDEIAYLDGHAWALGLNGGILWEINKANRIGVSYRSAIKLKLKGDYRRLLKPINQELASSVENTTVAGNLTLNLPAIIELSGFHQFATNWQLHYSAMHLAWDRFETLEPTYQNCSNGFCLLKEKSWQSTWRYALGISYLYSSDLTLRAGFASEKSPASTTQSLMGIPDIDRDWYSLGASIHATKNAKINLGFAFLKGKKAQGLDSENLASYYFDVSGNAFILSLGVNLSY